MEEDVFAVLHYDACDDYFYGYMESLYSVHPSFEKAKESVDSFLEKYKNEFQPFDGVDWDSFITIVQMKWGGSERIVLYNTTDFERKEQRIKEEKEERRKEIKERQKKKKEEEERRKNLGLLT